MAKGDWLPGALLGIAVKKFMGGCPAALQLHAALGCK